MTSIKTGSSRVNFNYNVNGVGAVVDKIIAGVSNEHGVSSSQNIETQEFDVSSVSTNKQVPVKLTKEELNYNIDSINQMIDALQQEADKISQNSQYTYEELANVDNVEKREEANAKRAEIESYITQLEYLKKEYEKSLRTVKYDEKAATDEYNNFVSNYDINYQDIDFELFTKCDYDTEKYLMQKYGQDYQNHEVDLLAIAENYVAMNKDKEGFDLEKYTKQFIGVDIDTGKERINAFDFYMYSTQEQKDMYHYIFANEGSEKANEYLNLIMDDINRNKGFAMASDYTNTLMLDDEEGWKKVVDLLSVNAKGLEDGVDTFFEGIDQLFKNDGTLSAEDYEKMFVLQYLQENTNWLDESYTFFSAAGNMVPSMLASAAVSVAATPAAGSVAASALMGMSAAGNAKHNALINGADTLAANIYAIANGSSEALLGYFLGSMPWISKESELGIKALLKEGKEEFIQEWVDAGLRAAILGEKIDLTQVPADSAKSFLMGVAMAGLFSGGEQVVKMAIDGQDIEIDTNKLLNYIQEHPNMTEQDLVFLANDLLSNNTNLDYIETDFSKMYDQDINSLKKYLQDAGLTNEQINRMIKYKDYTVNTAKAIEKSLHGQGALPHDIFLNKLRNSQYKTVVDGVTFISDSQEGLNNLVEYYNASKDNAQSSAFFANLETNYGDLLVITNIDSYTSYNSGNFVNIGSRTINHDAYQTLFHELGHFLDYNNKSQIVFDPLEQYIYEDYNKIKDGYEKFQKDYLDNIKQFDDYYFRNSQGIKELNDATYKAMDEKYGLEWRNNPSNYIDAFKTIKNDTYNKMKDNYVRNSGNAAISDILSAVGYDVEKGYGHDNDYFSRNSDNITDWGTDSSATPRTEIIANLNDLYWSGNFDKLYDYFPKTLVDSWRIGIEKVNGIKVR